MLCGSYRLVYDRIGVAPCAAILVDINVIHFPLTNFFLRDLVAMAIKLTTADSVRDVVVASKKFPRDWNEVLHTEVRNNQALVTSCNASIITLPKDESI